MQGGDQCRVLLFSSVISNLPLLFYVKYPKKAEELFLFLRKISFGEQFIFLY